MYLTSEKKQEIFKKHGSSASDSGSAEGQIALFTFRIAHLTEHLKENRKDFTTQQSLIRLVGKRRSLLQGSQFDFDGQFFLLQVIQPDVFVFSKSEIKYFT